MGRGSGNGGACGVGAALDRLHLDHERPLHATCHRWRAAMPAAPRSCGTTGWTARRCATTCLGCARARRTAPRVCGFLSVRPAARRRGGGAAVCGPRVLPSVIAGVVGVELVERFLDPREFVLGGLGVCVCAFRVCVCVCVCDRKRIASLVSMCSRGNCGSLSVADHPLRSGWWAGKWFSWSFSSALGEARRGESRRSPPCAFAFNTIALYQPSSFLNQIPFFAKKISFSCCRSACVSARSSLLALPKATATPGSSTFHTTEGCEDVTLQVAARQLGACWRQRAAIATRVVSPSPLLCVGGLYTDLSCSKGVATRQSPCAHGRRRAQLHHQRTNSSPGPWC